jgi:hypothetical protein
MKKSLSHFFSLLPLLLLIQFYVYFFEAIRNRRLIHSIQHKITVTTEKSGKIVVNIKQFFLLIQFKKNIFKFRRTQKTQDFSIFPHIKQVIYCLSFKCICVINIIFKNCFCFILYSVDKIIE